MTDSTRCLLDGLDDRLSPGIRRSAGWNRRDVLAVSEARIIRIVVEPLDSSPPVYSTMTGERLLNISQDGYTEVLSMTISARNKLSGEVGRIETDGVTAEVQITLAESAQAELTAVITETSVDELDIAEGETVTAVIKATEVMIEDEG